MRSGRRATIHSTTAATMRNIAAPTSAAGNTPNMTGSVHDWVLAGQLQITQSPIASWPPGDGLIGESQIHDLVRAMLCDVPSVSRVTRAHGLKALTDRYG